MTANNTVLRTNVQALIDADPWVAEQLAKSGERLAKLSREDYLSVLADLYQKVNPRLWRELLNGVKGESVEWMDTAIVVLQGHLRQRQNTEPEL